MVRNIGVEVGRIAGADDVLSEFVQLELDVVFNREPVKLVREMK